MKPVTHLFVVFYWCLNIIQKKQSNTSSHFQRFIYKNIFLRNCNICEEFNRSTCLSICRHHSTLIFIDAEGEKKIAFYKSHINYFVDLQKQKKTKKTMLFFQYLGTCIREAYIFVVIYLIVLNTTAFFMYKIDKKKAKKLGAKRIPEILLLTVAFFGGALGALLGMFFFHHKTRHVKFLILNPLFLLFWIVTMYVCLVA